MNGPSIIGIGTAVPEHGISQEQAAELAARFDPGNGRAVQALYRRSGVLQRGSVIADDAGQIELFSPDAPLPTTAERMGLYDDFATHLAEQAARSAIDRSGVRPNTLTHLITVSCTGFAAPGVDYELIRQLGLGADVRRTHIGFMGCHGAVNALAVARDFVRAEPGSRVLICCVELCSLHFEATPDAQGAAAAVIAAAPPGPMSITDVASIIIPDTRDLMSWSIGDRGFRMRLSPSVPVVLGEHIPAWMNRWLGKSGLTVGDVGSWAIHPGGPRVLSSIAEALGLNGSAIEASREVLASHGNMSSATLLFILDRLARADAPSPTVALAFGPGLAGEGIRLGA
ncbi:MAG: type III polyketide synthase [Phycisphaerales bacterium]